MLNSRFIEKRSIDYVPLAERHGKVWHLWPVWFSGDAHLATLAVGVLGITLGGNLLWTSVAVVAGCALGTFFMAFHSTQGPQLGLPQMIQSRPQFGYTGALLVWLVALIAYIGFNAFNQVLAVQALHQLSPTIPAASPLAIVVFAIAALGVAAVGYDSIHLAQRGFAYLMIGLLSVFSIGACLVLLIEVCDSAWHDNVSEAPRKIADCFLHLPAQAGAKPCVQRRREALLPAPAHFWRNPIRQAAPQQSLTLTVRNVILERQSRRKCEEVSIQEWSSAFDRTEHARAVHFNQNLLR